VLSNGERYQCASHVNGGDHACKVKVSVPRERAERIILECVQTQLFDPALLAELEKKFKAAGAPVIDYAARFRVLEAQEKNIIDAIAATGHSPAMLERLTEIEAKRSRMTAACTLRRLCKPLARPRRAASAESGADPEQLAAGGEAAHAAMRDVFPKGIDLEVHPSGRFLWQCWRPTGSAPCFMMNGGPTCWRPSSQ